MGPWKKLFFIPLPLLHKATIMMFFIVHFHCPIILRLLFGEGFRYVIFICEVFASLLVCYDHLKGSLEGDKEVGVDQLCHVWNIHIHLQRQTVSMSIMKKTFENKEWGVDYDQFCHVWHHHKFVCFAWKIEILTCWWASNLQSCGSDKLQEGWNSQCTPENF